MRSALRSIWNFNCKDKFLWYRVFASCSNNFSLVRSTIWSMGRWNQWTLGIFIRDMFVHGNAALSLVSRVPPNFILFFLIGYIAYRNISLKQALVGVTVAAVGLLIPTIIFLPQFAAFTGLSVEVFLLTFVLTIILSLAIIATVAIRLEEWRSYAIAAVIGLAIGAGLLSVTVWAVKPAFPLVFRNAIRCLIYFSTLRLDICYRNPFYSTYRTTHNQSLLQGISIPKI